MEVETAPNPDSQLDAQDSNKKPKRFQCHRCQRWFARLEHLQRHERTHTQEKPFFCQACDQRFSRSDLLVRHERLNHDPKRHQGQTRPSLNGSRSTGSNSPQKRRRTLDSTATLPPPPSLLSPTGPVYNPNWHSHGSPHMPSSASSPPASGAQQQMPFATLLMAAEHAHPQPQHQQSNPYAHAGQSNPYQTSQLMSPPVPQQQQYQEPIMSTHQPAMTSGYDFEDSLQDLAAFMENGPLSTYHFSSFVGAEMPIPFFSPESFSHSQDTVPVSAQHGSSTHDQQQAAENRGQDAAEEQGTFSRYGSRLPSLQPEDAAEKNLKDDFAGSRRNLADISQEDRQKISTKLVEFVSVIPPTFQLPSRLALSRYVAGYINGFHEHMPFLHIPTMAVDTCCPELLLAMAAVGAQYCFEGEKGVELFNVSQSIAAQRIKQRDSRLAAFHKHAESHHKTPGMHFSTTSPDEARSEHYRDTPRSASISGPLGLPSHGEEAASLLQRDDLMQTAQALIILMAMATWAKHREILREALAIQSVLATLVRDDGFKRTTVPADADWITWARHESGLRTKYVVFCFFNLHSIVYNIPALILNSELDMSLPCSATEFKAGTEAKWKETRAKSKVPDINFQDAFSRLFSRGSGNDISAYNSSLGNYILCHALIQHIFFVRQVSRYRIFNKGEIPNEDITSIEHALRNWQLAWKRNPESSLDPMNPNGPVTFNSTALLRLAYIRLNVDIGPGRALDTRDPVQIARAFSESPPLNRNPKLIRAVLHSAHALSIPIKIGVHLVAQTQTFNWSIQHSLCTLECAYLLSKWLEALSLVDANSISVDEAKIASLVRTMLDETEFAVPANVKSESAAERKYLSANVLRVWAKVFQGAQTWAIVDIIGTSLMIYADMLESG